jgi:hypothetical protein
MTKESVRVLLGEGESWAADDGADGDMWHYYYSSAPDPAKIVVEFAVILVLVISVIGWIVLLSYANSESSDSLVDLSGQSGNVHFFVYFGQDGKVRRLSALSRCHDR